ncbi:TonB-dependent receptor plug domain-containing protein [Maricaulis sp.]|uniref:TonB-dependent receptor plug domain-containing protein n=1 Tax=Maricaulis sp. TaxID=1486257 RepID=UPI002B267C9A|nr:TonB-dependent receptor [Maricaulis sp.]
MKTQFLTTSISVLALSVGFSAAAAAQSLDYAAMGDLFGEPVTAGATGAPQRSSDVPATMIIITQADIERFPERDIPGILRHFAGVDSDRYTFGQGEASVRGYNQPMAPRLLVLVNGRQVYLDHYGYTNWSAIPVQLSEIQQIEVVKGPQSALYGFNAVSGVVNIVTRNARFGEYQTATMSIGDGGYAEMSAVAGYQFSDAAALRLSIGGSRADQFDVGPFGNLPGATTSEAYIPTVDFDRLTGAAELSGRVGSVDYSIEATYAHVIQPEVFPLYFTGGADTTSSSIKGEVSSDTDYGIITARAYRNELTADYTTTPAQTVSVPYDNSVTVVQLQDIFKVGTNNTFRIGAEWRENEMTSTPDAGNGDVSYTVTSVSGMWSRNLNSDWTLTLAGRYDMLDLERSSAPSPFFGYSQADYDQSVDEFSYNAALSWKVDQRSTLRLTTGRGIQAPSLTEFGFTLTSPIATPFGPLPAAFVGDPTIQPTLITSYELAYDRQLTSNVQLRAAVFQVETESLKGFFGAAPDFVDLTTTPIPTFAFRFSNQGDSSMLGAEISLTGEHGPWRWGTNASVYDIEDSLTVNQAGFTHPVAFESGTPDMRLNANLGWSGDGWTVDAYANHVASSTQPREFAFGLPTLVDVDAYTALSVRVNREVNDRVDLNFTAQNANFGDGEQVTSGPGVAARYWFGLTADF